MYYPYFLDVLNMSKQKLYQIYHLNYVFPKCILDLEVDLLEMHFHRDTA